MEDSEDEEFSSSVSIGSSDDEDEQREQEHRENIFWARGIVWLEERYQSVLCQTAAHEEHSGEARRGGGGWSSCPFCDLSRNHFSKPEEQLLQTRDDKNQMNEKICKVNTAGKLYSIYQHAESRQKNKRTDERCLHQALLFIMQELQDKKEITIRNDNGALLYTPHPSSLQRKQRKREENAKYLEDARTYFREREEQETRAREQQQQQLAERRLRQENDMTKRARTGPASPWSARVVITMTEHALLQCVRTEDVTRAITGIILGPNHFRNEILDVTHTWDNGSIALTFNNASDTEFLLQKCSPDSDPSTPGQLVVKANPYVQVPIEAANRDLLQHRYAFAKGTERVKLKTRIMRERKEKEDEERIERRVSSQCAYMRDEMESMDLKNRALNDLVASLRREKEELLGEFKTNDEKLIKLIADLRKDNQWLTTSLSLNDLQSKKRQAEFNKLAELKSQFEEKVAKLESRIKRCTVSCPQCFLDLDEVNNNESNQMVAMACGRVLCLQCATQNGNRRNSNLNCHLLERCNVCRPHAINSRAKLYLTVEE